MKTHHLVPLIGQFLFLVAVALGVDIADNEVCDDRTGNCPEAAAACRPFRVSDFGPESRSVVFGRAFGRLGNQLLGYALLLHFRHHVGLDAYISWECKEYLLKVFTPESVEMPVLEDTFCNPEAIPWEAYHGHIKDLLTDPVYRRGKFILLYPPTAEDSTGYRPEDHLSPEQEKMQQAYLEHLRKSLHFKPNLVTRVRKTMKSVAKKLGKKPSQVTYVGIHNRLTDSIEFIRRDWFQEPIEKDFFIDAMEYFREEYENVAFLYVSDDMEWGRQNLKDNHGDLFFVGDGTETDDGIGFDLAILVSSNHTIITRGTYSMWGAMLNGGEYFTEYGVIVPTHLQG